MVDNPIEQQGVSFVGFHDLDGRRPLAANRADLERLYTARVDTYRLAHVRVAAGRGAINTVVDRVLDALHQLPPSLAPAGAGD